VISSPQTLLSHSAHAATLRRHACSTLVVWYVPAYLLGVMSFMLAAAFAAVMANVGYYTFTARVYTRGCPGE
jgi:hypothetical protein